MKRYQQPALLAMAVTATFLAITIIDVLIREFSHGVTYVDLGAIYVLGLITGAALGLSVALRGARTA